MNLIILLIIINVSEEFEVIRDYNGDIFKLTSLECHNNISCDIDDRYAATIPDDCKCQCEQTHSIFREDIGQCVEDINDCPLAAFIRPYISERIPVVSLPVAIGQLVHPGAHLTISGIAHLSTPQVFACETESSQFMTTNGWTSIEDRAFELFEDGNKTFLQWLGNDSIRRQLQHKLVLIRLRCTNEQMSSIVYNPCVAIRIAWTPGMVDTSITTDTSKTNHNNYLIIGLCLGILGLMYVLSLMIYVRTKKSQSRKRSDNKTMTSPSTPQRRDSFDLMESGESNREESDNKEDKPSDDTNRVQFLTSDRISRRTLHIDPQFFDPELMASPPPPAIEFLHRIREMIASAKGRIRNFKFRPTLLVIPEDDYFYHDKSEERKDDTPPLPPPRPARGKKTMKTNELLNSMTSSNETSKFDEFRKDLVKKLNDDENETIDEDKSEEFDATPLDSLKLLSARIARKLTDQRNYNCEDDDKNFKRMKLSDNWTMMPKIDDTETTSDNCTSGDESCHACHDCHEADASLCMSSLPSVNGTGYECDAGTSTDTWSLSSGEVSTTSSVVKCMNHSIESTSICSDITEDSLNVNGNHDLSINFSDNDEEEDDDDNNPIEVCLKQLANAPIDGSRNVDRATKGLSALYKIKSEGWNHVCHHRVSNHHNGGYLSDDTSLSSAASMAFRATDEMSICARDRKMSEYYGHKRRSRMSGYSQSKDEIDSISKKFYRHQKTPKLMTKHPCRGSAKLSVFRGNSEDMCHHHREALSEDDTRVNDAQKQSRPTNGTCKKYIQQKSVHRNQMKRATIIEVNDNEHFVTRIPV